MKKTIILAAMIITSACSKAQQLISWQPIGSFGGPKEKNPKWDFTKESICGLGIYCPFKDGSHYYTSKVRIPDDPDGCPIYGIEQAYIGVITKTGEFVATKRRDHLIGKPIDRALLEDPARLIDYVKKQKQ